MRQLTPETLIAERVDFNLIPSANYSAIAYGVDSNFLLHAGVSIMSVIDHTVDVNMHFVVITNSRNNSEFARFAQLVENTEHALSIIIISERVFTVFPRNKVFPASIYYRLVAPLILSQYKYLLYLDADIVALTSLSELLQKHRPEDAVCCIVPEPEDQVCLSASLGIQSGSYFNSGVLYINIAQWLSRSITEKVFQCLSDKNNEFIYFDQDALNMVLAGQVTYLDRKFNQQIKAGHSKKKLCEQAPANTVLLHYVGEDKPWQQWNRQPFGEYYRKYRFISPWKHIDYIRAHGARQLKKHYKTLCYEKKYVLCLLIFIRFQIQRLLDKRS